MCGPPSRTKRRTGHRPQFADPAPTARHRRKGIRLWSGLRLALVQEALLVAGGAESIIEGMDVGRSDVSRVRRSHRYSTTSTALRCLSSVVVSASSISG